MVKTLSKFAAVILLAASVSCAAAPVEEPVASEGGEFASIDDALSASSNPARLAYLEVAATYDDDLHAVMIDLTSNHLPEGIYENVDPHDGDYFQAVKVYLENPSTGRRVLATLGPSDYYGPKAIGPGGGCIHFRLTNVKPGDRILVGAVVALEGATGSTIAAAPQLVINGEWTPDRFGKHDLHGH